MVIYVYDKWGISLFKEKLNTKNFSQKIKQINIL